MICYIAGLSLSRIPALAAYKQAWRVFAGYAKRIRETSFTSHQHNLIRLWAEMHHQEYLVNDENTRTCRLQASLTRLRGVCEADSWNEFHETLLNGSCIYMMRCTASYICRNIEAVTTRRSWKPARNYPLCILKNPWFIRVFGIFQSIKIS